LGEELADLVGEGGAIPFGQAELMPEFGFGGGRVAGRTQVGGQAFAKSHEKKDPRRGAQAVLWDWPYERARLNSRR
jgi:hypothetical protein